jgi:hypothetical protein
MVGCPCRIGLSALYRGGHKGQARRIRPETTSISGDAAAFRLSMLRLNLSELEQDDERDNRGVLVESPT